MLEAQKEVVLLVGLFNLAYKGDASSSPLNVSPPPTSRPLPDINSHQTTPSNQANGFTSHDNRNDITVPLPGEARIQYSFSSLDFNVGPTSDGSHGTQSSAVIQRTPPIGTAIFPSATLLSSRNASLQLHAVCVLFHQL